MIRRYIYIIFAVCVFFGAPVLAADAVKVADIDIKVYSPAEKQALWKSVASSFIPIKVGDDYTLGAMDTAIKALTDSQLFEFIHVPDPEKTQQGMRVVFQLTPFARIRDIHINHAFPLFEQEVLNAMTIKVGGVYQAQKMEDQAQRVEKLFISQGFYRPKVDISAVEEGEGYVIDVDIEKGPFHQIRKIVFKGNDHVGPARLKLVTGIWRTSLLPWMGNRFTEKKMKEDIKKVMQFYRKKGYADVQVTAQPVLIEGLDSLDVVFSIDEGPLYRIDIQGNDSMFTWTLKKNFCSKRRVTKMILP